MVEPRKKRRLANKINLEAKTKAHMKALALTHTQTQKFMGVHTQAHSQVHTHTLMHAMMNGFVLFTNPFLVSTSQRETSPRIKMFPVRDPMEMALRKQLGM